MCGNQMRNNSVWGQSSRCGTGEKGESVALPKGFDVWYKRKRKVKDNFKIFGLRN